MGYVTWAQSNLMGILAVGAILLAACAPATSPRSTGSAPGSAASQAARSVTVLTRAEPPGLATTSLTYTGISVSAALRPFNAGMVLNDGHDQARPYLAEALPQLNTDTWRLLPGSTMETSYRLKHNLNWQDGNPISSEDVVFAWRVYSTPAFGISYIGDRVDSIRAPDDRTVVVRWKVLYPLAAITENVFPLPRHLLEQSLTQGTPESFVSLPFWTQQYIGAGPYRLERWEPGSFIEGVAFDGHVLGRPRIDRIRVQFSADENTALANLLAESVQVVADRSIRFEQVQVLNEDWARTGKGVTVLTPSQNRWTVFQARPDYVNPSTLLDLRVRQAVVSAIDREALNEGLFAGRGVMAPTVIRPSVPYYAEVDRAIVKYPYDPRRTEQLMSESGFTRGPDGVFVTRAGERFTPQLMNQAGAQPERETSIMVENWRRAGIDASTNIVPVSQSRDAQARATFPALQNASGGSGTEDKIATIGSSSDIGTPQNRWMGDNRGGWSHPEYDRLAAALQSTLEPVQRGGYVAAMEKLLSEQVPIAHLFFNFGATAYLAVLDGPDRTIFDDTYILWNVHEWRFR